LVGERGGTCSSGSWAWRLYTCSWLCGNLKAAGEGGEISSRGRNTTRPKRIGRLPRSCVQQKSGAFWERISTHYDEYKPTGFRLARSLESKWGLIKHDVDKFIGAYKQVVSLNPSGTSLADLLHMAKILYRSKSAKNTEFVFQHCWEIVKDFPRWADGWGTMKQTNPSKRKAIVVEESGEGSRGVTVDHVEGSSDVGGNRVFSERPIGSSDVGGNHVLSERPIGTRAAKEGIKEVEKREGAMYAQAETTIVMAVATVRKTQMIEDHNSILLMMLVPPKNISEGAREYLKLRQREELIKLRNRLHDKEQQQLELLNLERERVATQEREHEETSR
jgi:hypothetical protein